MRYWWLFSFLLVLTAGCSSEPADAEQAFKDKGILDVLSEAGEDDFDPPADGKLTDAQVKMYLEVRKRERDLAKVAAEQLRQKGEELKESEQQGGLSAAWKGLGALQDLTNLVTSDIRAAQELGYNTAEYQWVKSQVIEAGLATWSENVRQQSNASVQRSLEQLKEARDKAANDQMREFYDQQIATYEKLASEQAQGDETSEAVRYNQQLLKTYADEIKLLEDEIKKYGLATALGGTRSN